MIKITNDKGTEQRTIRDEELLLSVSSDEIERMLKDAEKFKMDDVRVKEKIEPKSEFEAYVYAVKAAIDECGSSLSPHGKVSSSRPVSRRSSSELQSLAARLIAQSGWQTGNSGKNLDPSVNHPDSLSFSGVA